MDLEGLLGFVFYLNRFNSVMESFLEDRLGLGFGQADEIVTVILYIPLVLFALGYIYIHLCYRKIAINLKQDDADISLVPVFGPVLVAFRTAKTSSWPLLLLHVPLVGNLIFASILNSTLALIITSLSMLVLIWLIFSWHASMYENCGKPRAWSWMLLIIGIIGSIIPFGGDLLSRNLENALIGTISMIVSLVIFLIMIILFLIFIGKAAFNFEGIERRGGNFSGQYPQLQTVNYGSR